MTTKFAWQVCMSNFVDMRLDSYISDLLYRYQCVTIPGFGAFITESTPARLDREGGFIFPPSKQIAFNSYIQKNDGLLAQHMALELRISYEAALHLIEQTVIEWKNAMHQKQPLFLKNIGHFTLNADLHMVFKPFDYINYNTASFGLTGLAGHVIKRDSIAQRHISVKENQSQTIIIREPEVEAESQEPIQENEPKLIPISSKSKWHKYVAAAIFGLGICGVAAYQYTTYYIEQQTLIVEQNVRERVEQKIQEATFFVSAPLSEVEMQIEKPIIGNYAIVGGAFRSYDNAQKKQNELVNLGFKAQIGEINKYGLYPVFYGRYTEHEKATAALFDIQKSYNAEAWILILP
jgi:nucleoid DNA-binding protein